MITNWQSNSRISLYERRKLIRQSLFFFVAGIVLLIVFFFLVLPITARLMDTITHGKPVTSPQTQEQLRTPELQPLISATNSANIRIWGYVQDNSNVALFQNGSKQQTATPDSSGLFSFDSVVLQKGDNQFYVQASNDKGAQSSPSQMYTVTYKTDPPKLDVQSPADGLTVTNQRNQVVSISGTTDPQVNVFLNDRQLTVDVTGAFTGNYQLNNGDNTLSLRAIDAAGNTSTKDVHVTYLP